MYNLPVNNIYCIGGDYVNKVGRTGAILGIFTAATNVILFIGLYIAVMVMDMNYDIFGFEISQTTQFVLVMWSLIILNLFRLGFNIHYYMSGDYATTTAVLNFTGMRVICVSAGVMILLGDNK